MGGSYDLHYKYITNGPKLQKPIGEYAFINTAHIAVRFRGKRVIVVDLIRRFNTTTDSYCVCYRDRTREDALVKVVTRDKIISDLW